MTINHPDDMNERIRQVGADAETALHFARLGFFAAYRLNSRDDATADGDFDDWWSEVTS